MLREFPVTADTGPAMARAATRYRLTRPGLLAALAMYLVIAVLFAAAGQGGWAVVAVAAGLAVPAGLLIRLPSVGRALRLRGFRPGTIVSVDWEQETFVVRTPDAHATYRYDQVRHAAVVGDAVVIRLAVARLLVVLPAELVPAEVRPILDPRLRPPERR